MPAQQPDRRPGHVFISYVREDAERVDQLERELTEAGFRVWRDIGAIGVAMD